MVARKRAGSSPLSSMESGDEQADIKPDNVKATRANGSASRQIAAATPKASPKLKTPSKSKVKKEEASDEEMLDGKTEPIESAKIPKSTPRKRAKKEHSDDAYIDEATPATPANKTGGRRTRGSAPKSYTDDVDDDKKDVKEEATPSKKSTPSKASTLAKKLKQLEAYLQTPFPEHTAPSPEQCQEVQDGLAAIHGLPRRPEKLVDIPGAPAGCGAVPDVLDALVRTILSQNTTSKNSTAAKNAIDAKFGRADYVAVHKATNEELEDTIRCGGLAQIKARVIKQVIASNVERQIASGEIKDESELRRVSLDYLHDMTDLDAMKELVSFDGVGPKTASCVLLFCLGRNSFAVDTHVFRITKALGWTPAKANRETAFQHLDVRIPDENKYPLHALLVRHGRSCRLCSANGNITDPEVDSSKCPIKSIIKAKRTSKGVKGEEDDDDDVHDLLPGEIEDEDEKKGKPPAGPPPGTTELESQWDGKVAGHS